jgi:O-antigen/teichoic acid export membrane protein
VHRLLAKLRGARWVGAGLLDQLVIAVANAGNTLLGPILLDDRARAGLMLLALGVGYFAMYINRAFVGDVLIAMASRYDGERRDRLVRNGLTTAAVAGLAGGVLFLLIWAVWPRGGDVDLLDLIWLAPFLPAIMLHDTARCTYLARRQPEKALTIDLVWAGTQAVIVTAMILLDSYTPGGLLMAWGIGAVAGATIFHLRERQRPWRGDPRQWLAETRHLSGWFTATAVVGQVQVQAVSFLVGYRLTAAEIAGLRFVQTIQMQPVQNLITAVQGLIVPRASVHAADAAKPGLTGQEAAAALRRQTRLLALGFTLLGLLMVLVVWPIVSYALSQSQKWADVAPLALPIALQGMMYMIQVPFTAAIRGMHRAKLLFAQYVVFSAVSLTGLVIGAQVGGLLGAVWGLFAGTTTGLLCMIAMYWHAVRHLANTPTPTEEPVELV